MKIFLFGTKRTCKSLNKQPWETAWSKYCDQPRSNAANELCYLSCQRVNTHIPVLIQFQKAPTMASDDITATSGKTVSCIVIWQEGYDPKTIQPTTSPQRTVLKNKVASGPPFMQVIRFDTPRWIQNSGYDSQKHKYTCQSPLGHLTGVTGACVFRTQCDVQVTRFTAHTEGEFKWSSRVHMLQANW